MRKRFCPTTDIIPWGRGPKYGQGAALSTPVPAIQNPQGCTCHGCGARYLVDIIVDDETWERIKPAGAGPGAGLLCGACITARLEALGEPRWIGERGADIPVGAGGLPRGSASAPEGKRIDRVRGAIRGAMAEEGSGTEDVVKAVLPYLFAEAGAGVASASVSNADLAQMALCQVSWIQEGGAEHPRRLDAIRDALARLAALSSPLPSQGEPVAEPGRWQDFLTEVGKAQLALSAFKPSAWFRLGKYRRFYRDTPPTGDAAPGWIALYTAEALVEALAAERAHADSERERLDELWRWWKREAQAGEARIAKLEEALEPFAECADSFDIEGRVLADDDGIYAFTAGDFRRARAALRARNILKEMPDEAR